jgi:epoxyqueuosine reductase
MKSAESEPSLPPTPNAELIRDRVLALGFDAVGWARPDDIGDAGDRLAEFIDRGWYGDMGWLAERSEVRRSPDRLWPDAQTAIVVGSNYGPDENPLSRRDVSGLANISVYAHGRDYHKLLKKRLRELGRWIGDTYGADCKLFVDTAPLMEKPLAQAANIGWIGKHTNLVSREFGSWLFLGVLLTTLKLQPSEPARDHCGGCSACLDVCPTDAFPSPYQLDARRCISYLTIEHKGHIPVEFRRAIGNRIYGCDDCLAVCPWNKFARPTEEAGFRSSTDISQETLINLAGLDDEEFRRRFSGTAIKRTGRDRFLRNVLIAIGNSGERDAIPLVEDALGDPSPLVRAMAVWALGQLSDASDFIRLRARFSANESDVQVLAEWDRSA